MFNYDDRHPLPPILPDQCMMGLTCVFWSCYINGLVLSRIVEMETKGWFPEFKEKVLSQLKTEYKDARTLQAEANK